MPHGIGARVTENALCARIPKEDFSFFVCGDNRVRTRGQNGLFENCFAVHGRSQCGTKRLTANGQVRPSAQNPYAEQCAPTSPLISYCGSSGVAWWVYPLRSTFFWLTPVIVPVTRPASEFQTTWSPTLNLRILNSFMALVEF